MSRVKAITVLDLVSHFGQGGGDIPVVVRQGTDDIGRARCGYSAPAVLADDVLNMEILYFTVSAKRITIQVKK